MVLLCRMTLGNVYDMDLKKNETLIKDVIIQAQGEVGSTIYFRGVCLNIVPIDGS